MYSILSPAFSCLAFSPLAISMVSRFHALLLGPSFSCLAFLFRVILIVFDFHVLHFQFILPSIKTCFMFLCPLFQEQDVLSYNIGYFHQYLSSFGWMPFVTLPVARRY